ARLRVTRAEGAMTSNAASMRHLETIGEPVCGRQFDRRSDATAEAAAERLSPACGALLTGIDLSQPLAPAAKQRVLAAFRDYHVLVFPDQVLSRQQQYEFSANFGEVERSGGSAGALKRHGVAHVITNLDAEGKPADRSSSPVSNYRWHTDKAYRPLPPRLTTLYAVEVPAGGGDTEFANTAQAYDALPPATKRRIDGLRVVFRWGASRERSAPGSILPGPISPSMPELQPAVDHPLVRAHPDTGAKALYLGNHSSHIAGLPEAEGRALLDALVEHATQRRFVYAHRWRIGDLVMWDNCCLLHRAVANFDTARERRILHRTVVKGTLPV
ncbi:MAG: TauD/TfdA family dioxygenase, partial [Stellaceae bacterium]